MTKIYLTMSNDDWLRLTVDAEKECRHPRDHARYLLRRALGIANEQPTVSDKTQSDAGRIREGSLASAAL